MSEVSCPNFIYLFNFQKLVKGGVTFNAIFDYNIEGSAEERLCPSCVTGPLRAKACIGVSEGWPNNRINVEAWYQKRSISKCKGKFTVSQCSHF